MRFILFITISMLLNLNAELVLVTNKLSPINSLSKESIKYLYLAKVSKINNIKIQPLLSQDKKLHKKFVNEIIDKSLPQYDSYWARLVFTGRKAIPKRLDKNEINKELMQLNTIIYLDKNDLNHNLKIIYE